MKIDPDLKLKLYPLSPIKKKQYRIGALDHYGNLCFKTISQLRREDG